MLPNADTAHLREFELDLYVAAHAAAVKLTCREQAAVSSSHLPYLSICGLQIAYSELKRTFNKKHVFCKSSQSV
jgi:hypothetical protein